MEAVTAEKINVKMSESKSKLCSDITSDKYSKAKGELEINKKVSPKKLCWRLIHDGESVLHLFESEGITHTLKNMVCGTLEECNAEILRLNLKVKVKK